MADAPKIKPTDTLRESYPKLNQAIDNANEALRNSEEALNTANQALTNSENTQEQLDQIVIEGDSSVEAAQARVDADGNVFTTLKERLDTKEQSFSAQLAQTAKKDYVDFQDSILNSKIKALSSGSPAGVYNTLEDLINAYPNGDNKIYLVAKDGNWYFWDGSTWVSGGVYQSVLPSEFVAVNLIRNGDFKNGLTGGWVSRYSDTTVDSQNGVINTANGERSFGQLGQDISGLKIGDKYYVKASVTPFSQTQYVGVGVNYAEEPPSVINHPEPNKEVMVSGIFTITNEFAHFFIRHNYQNETTANGKQVRINYVLAINLTEIFGKGYEPTVDEINRLIQSFPNDFFNGSVQLAKAEDVYRKLVDTSRQYQPILDIPRTGIMVKGEDGTYHARELLGTANQIEITHPDGVGYHPQIGIPTNASPLRPEIIQVTYGDNISPDIETWQGDNDAYWDNDNKEWVIPRYGSIYTTIHVEKGKEYHIDIEWSDTNRYHELDFYPKLYVKMGSVLSGPQFTGYSDAIYVLTMVAEETGEVEFRLGDENEPWSAKITNVIIRPIEEKVSRAGRIGIGSMHVYTYGNNLAIGGGHSKRSSGQHNYAYGLEAQRDLTVGNGNVAFGSYAQQLLQTGIYNSAFGHNALRRLVTGTYNTAIGYSALGYAYDGNWNVALGNEAARDLTSGNRNTALGSRALFSLTTGNDNVAVGRLAGEFPKQRTNRTTEDKRQTLVGTETGKWNNEQADNLTALGFHAIGSENATALGAYTEAQGKGSVAIGLDSDGGFAKAMQDDEFVLGTEKHHVKAKGRFNIRQFTPSDTSDPQGDVGDITTDDDYIYVKTSQGWKRSALETF